MVETPLDATVHVAEVEDAEPFPEARKSELVKLWLSLGDESLQSAAQLGYHHDSGDLVGTRSVRRTRGRSGSPASSRRR